MNFNDLQERVLPVIQMQESCVGCPHGPEPEDEPPSAEPQSDECGHPGSPGLEFLSVSHSDIPDGCPLRGSPELRLIAVEESPEVAVFRVTFSNLH